MISRVNGRYSKRRVPIVIGGSLSDVSPWTEHLSASANVYSPGTWLRAVLEGGGECVIIATVLL